MLHATRGVHKHAWRVGRRCRRDVRSQTPQTSRDMRKHAWGSGRKKDRLDRGGTKLTHSCLSLLLTLCAIRIFWGGTVMMPAPPVGC